MSQHDYVIANGTGAAVRSDLNNALAAIVSNNSGATEPATMYAYQWWADTSTGLLKLRNAANNAWITLRELDGTLTIEAGTVSAPGLAFASDLNTGVFSAGADQLAIATNGVERVEWGTSEVVFNDGGANYDFRIEGDTNSSLFFVDASAEAVGIGTTNPGSAITQFGGSASGLAVAASQPVVALEDTTATTYAYFGLQNNDVYIDNLSAGFIRFATSNTERGRWDSSGRFLVGTSSGSGTNYLQIQGDTGSSAGTGGISLRRGLAPSLMGEGSTMGIIDFGPNDGGVGARIAGIGDALQGTNDYPSRLVFSTTADGASSPTERMRISNAGKTNLFDSSGGGLRVSSAAAAGSTDNIFTGFYSATSTTSEGTASIAIRTNGDVRNANNSYGSLSDAKLKENIVNASSQWDDLKALQVRNFNFKEGQTHRQIGLIAQEVELVSPGLVNETPDRDEEGNDLGTVTKSVNYSVLYMKAVKALQEAMERIETLEAKVAALEAS
jgi:hypothetical protein